MDLFEAIQRRRSVRKYTNQIVPNEIIDAAIDAALLAPNSSNLQTWEFFWFDSQSSKRDELVKACLDQNAARTSQHLLVVVANPSLWKKHKSYLIEQFNKSSTPAIVYSYYNKLIPMLYGYCWLAPLRWILFNILGLFRPTTRKPWSRRDIAEISIKSSALAAENFMLAISAKGFDTCPMEGIDEHRIKKILKLKRSARVTMVISVGQRDPKGLWGERVRVPRDWVVKKI